VVDPSHHVWRWTAMNGSLIIISNVIHIHASTRYSLNSTTWLWRPSVRRYNRRRVRKQPFQQTRYGVISH
jgi:hypothetical protein